MNRDRILLLMEHHVNRRLLGQWLGASYDVIEADDEATLHRPFDLCMTDGMTLTRMLEAVRARKELEREVFLPVLLSTPRQELGSGMRRAWEVVDEVIS